MSTFKRQLNHNLSQSTGEEYPHQYELQSIGMRIRKAVSDGYQTPNSATNQDFQQKSNVFQRVPLPSNVVVPPLLSNSSSSMSTYGSNLEEWESNLDNRLQTIGDNLVNQKEALTKRRFDAIDSDW